MSRKTPSVVLVGRPNVGKSTLFNRITGSRRAIVAPIAGTTRDALARPVVWRGVPFQLFDTGGLVRRQRGSAARARRPAGAARDRRRRSAGASRRRTRRAGPRRRDDRARAARDRAARCCWRSTRPTTSGRSESAMEFFQLGFEPVIEISAEHGTGVADLLDEIVERLGDTGSGLGLRARDRRAARSHRRRRRPSRAVPSPDAADRETTRRHRRPAERRQVVAGEPAAARRAGAGQRHAGHDARRDRRAADLAPPPLPHRRHRRHAAARTRRAAAARSRWSACAGAKEAIADADVVALVIDAQHGRDRSGRGDRRRSRPRRAAASSSSRTSGTS